MKKILLILSFLTPNLFAYSDGQYVIVSSNSYYNLVVNTNTTVQLINNTTRSSNTIRQIVFTNISSSQTVFFSTSTNASSVRASGTPLYALEHLTIDIDPNFPVSTNTSNTFSFLGEGGDAISATYVRAWIRHIR